MHPALPLILSLFIALTTYANPPERRSKTGDEELAAANIEKLTQIVEQNREAKEGPKYSSLKRLSNVEVNKALEEFTGREDTWKNKTSLLSRAMRLVPFQKKTTVAQEREALSYIFAKRTNSALQEYTFRAHNSQHEAISGMIVNVQGDKRLVLNSFRYPSSDLRAILLFFKSIEYGDTGLETKKFQEYALAFDHLAQRVQRAYRSAADLNMPLIIEFESSALMQRSPLTREFFTSLMRDKSMILKVEVTPNRGRIVAIHPYYAKAVVQNLNLFADQFKLKVNTLRNRIFTDTEAKQRLLDLIRYGEGVSGLLYTDERIQELAINKSQDKSSDNVCSKFFD